MKITKLEDSVLLALTVSPLLILKKKVLSVVNKMIDIRGKYEDIFLGNFSEALIKTLYHIYKFRKESSLN